MDHAHASDNELMVRLGDGDAAALEALMRRWEGRVTRVLRGLAAGDSDVDGLRQEVFVRVYAARRRYRVDGAFSTWLYAITANVARDSRRRRDAFLRHLGQIAGARNGNGAHVDARAPPPSPETRLRAEETRRLVETAVARLPERLRTALVLKHYGELSFDEVAQVTRLPASTVKSRVKAALEELRKELAKLGIDHEDIDP